MKLQTILKLLIFFFLTSLILLSPLLIGSVEPFSNMLLRLQIAIIFTIWLLYSYLYENFGKNSLKFYLLLFFLLLCLFQITPLPSFLVKLLSPRANEIWNFNSYIFEQTEWIKSSSFQTISLVPHYTTNKMLSILCYIFLGYVVSKTVKTKRSIIFLVYLFGFIVLIESALGSYQFLTGNTSFDINKKYVATGSFVNKNHLAGFFELTIPVVICYIFYRIFYLRNSNNSLASTSIKTLEIAALSIISGFSLIVFIFTFSRLGYLSLICSIIICFLIYVRTYGKLNKKTVIPLLFIAAFLIFGIYKSFDIFSERVSINNIDVKGRVVVFKDTLRAIKDFPVFGSGLGTFKEIYPAYKTLDAAVTVNFTHNDYLQLTLETGIFGICVLLAALFLFFKSTLSKLKILYQSHDKFYFFVKLGCLTGITSMLIHSLGDFNLHIPSNAVYFSILFGIIASKDVSSEKIKAKKKRVKKRKIKNPTKEAIALPGN